MAPAARLHELFPVLDVVGEGIILLHPDGQLCYRNSAASRLLALDAERAILLREIRALSRSTRGGPTLVELVTAAGRYQLRAERLVHPFGNALEPVAIVVIRRDEVMLPTTASLIRRFRLTPREASVALLLARGQRNSTIARALQIRPSTARHYTENVLLKLGVHTRGEVGSVLLSLHPRAPGHHRAHAAEAETG